MARLVRVAVAQQILADQLPDALEEVLGLAVRDELGDRLAPRNLGADLERVSPPRCRNPLPPRPTYTSESMSVFPLANVESSSWVILLLLCGPRGARSGPAESPEGVVEASGASPASGSDCGNRAGAMKGSTALLEAPPPPPFPFVRAAAGAELRAAATVSRARRWHSWSGHAAVWVVLNSLPCRPISLVVGASGLGSGPV